MLRSKSLIVTLIILLITSVSHAQKKVAVVLSGGGAKGLAHVGVLKALEENEIPIDYIVGTSMGGIVAGCYAAGYTPTEIELMMLSDDFQRWVNGELEQGFNYYYSKDDENASFLSLKLSLDSSFNASISSSLASDLSLNFALLERFAQPAANANYNFDSLLVPTRIMAADVFTQSEVSIDSGSLGSAVRATLSVPFFYKPIRFNGKYLFDGGIYNNFPVDVAQKEFDPDVIIGVNVSSKIFNDYPTQEDESLLNQSLLFMLLDKSDPESIPESGVYIEPNLEGFTSFDFVRSAALIDSGYVATNRKMSEISSKVQRTMACDDLTERRNAFGNRNKPLIFSDIKFQGFNSKQRKFIKHIFRYKEGEPLYFSDIKRGYFRLVSEEYFRTIYPDISYHPETDAYNLEIYGRPESNLNVEVGGVIATRNISQIFLGADYYYFNNYLLKTSIEFYTGSFYKSAQLKSRINLPALGQFYVETDLTYNNWDYINDEDILTQTKEPTVLIRTDRKYGLNLGFPVGSKFKAVVSGARINNTDRFSNLQDDFNSRDTLDVLDLNGYKAGLEIARNSLNRKQYASNGSAFTLNLDYFQLEEHYQPGSTSLAEMKTINDHQWLRARATIQQYFKKGRYSSGYYFQANISNQPLFSNYMSTLVNTPGFNGMVDSQTLFLQNFRAHNYVTLGLRNVLAITSNLDFRAEAYAFKPFEAIQQNGDQTPAYASGNFKDIYFAGTASVVLHSPIGPISLSANYYDDPETKFGLLMHVGYLLYQRRSMN
ncbi:patatin [Fulvivirga sp. RKSG066]|uniref:patatin-like phospholipase family protein n=1 Tax=Fulvivirga aurantia TaxID=2529383 RepID=UPI0012BC3E97|nr:patatin-like phospholipase family protein [Fulvivirga aurantia]MTI22708.1 patatin [Fulvivirga aurantia]